MSLREVAIANVTDIEEGQMKAFTIGITKYCSLEFKESSVLSGNVPSLRSAL